MTQTSDQANGTSFIIERLSIKLRVELRANGSVKIDPFGGSKENQRLWSVIAKTQTTVAQMHLDLNKTRPKADVLISLFTRNDWNVYPLDENKDTVAAAGN